MRKMALLLALSLLAASATAQDVPLKDPRLLSWSQQIAVREQWLEKRHQMILPMMRERGIDIDLGKMDQKQIDELVKTLGREAATTSPSLAAAN